MNRHLHPLGLKTKPLSILTLNCVCVCVCLHLHSSSLRYIISSLAGVSIRTSLQQHRRRRSHDEPSVSVDYFPLWVWCIRKEAPLGGCCCCSCCWGWWGDLVRKRIQGEVCVTVPQLAQCCRALSISSGKELHASVINELFNVKTNSQIIKNLAEYYDIMKSSEININNSQTGARADRKAC